MYFKNKYLPVWVLFFLFLNVQLCSSQALRFYADTAFAMPGGIATLQLEVSEPASLDPKTIENIDAWKALLDKEDTLWLEPWQRQGTKWALPIRMMFLDTGKHYFPPLTVSIVQDKVEKKLSMQQGATVIIEPFPLTDQELADIKDIIPEPKLWTDFFTKPVLIVLAFCLFAALALFYYFYKKRKGKPSPTRTLKRLTPSAKALQALSVLEKKRLHETESWKAYYSELTFILRTYLEEAKNIEALESTSDEILNKIQTFYSEDERNALEQLFIRADLVKFAKGLPPAAYYAEAFDLTKKIVGG